MATLAELQQALVLADKAGATDDARALAKAIIDIKSKAAPQPVATQSQQLEDPGALNTILIGAGRTFDRVGKGMQQLYYGATGNDKKLQELDAAAKSDDEAYKPLQEARPFATGLGEALPSMILPGGGAKTLIGTAGKMAASAAIPAALEYGSAGDRAMNAALAGGAAAAVPFVGFAAKSAKSFAEPLYAAGRDQIVGRTLNRVAGDDAAKVVAKLKGASPLVPGSLPTAAEVAENGGIAALQRSAAQSSPTEFAQRGMEQASARLDALRGIAGDASKIDAAKQARAAVTGPAYEQAKNAVYVVDDKLQSLLNRPAVKKAMARAEALAGNEERPFAFSTTSSSPFAGVGGPAAVQTKQVTGRSLQDLKMAMDDMLADPASGVVGREAEQVRGLRNQIVNWMESANPEFGKARTQYAQMSVPINQMQVGQELLGKLQPALSDHGALGKETGARFAQTLRDTDSLVKNATGFKGAQSLEQLMGPKMDTINAIAQDLARKQNAETLGKGIGSDTFQKLAMQNIAEQSGMPRIVGGLLDFPIGISRATKWVYRDTDEQAQKVIADAMLNPQKAAQLMEAAKQGLLSDKPKLRQALIQTGLRTGGLLSVAEVAPQ